MREWGRPGAATGESSKTTNENEGKTMFRPNFHYTNKIVNTLVDITTIKDFILNAQFVPRWQVKFQREALIRAAHASTAIEGNPLSLDEVRRLAEGKEVLASGKAKNEVLNYLDVLKNITRYQEKGKMTEEILLELHGDVTRETLKDVSYEGDYRPVQVYVGNSLTGEVIFMPPPPEEVPDQTRKFIEWLNSPGSYDLHPVLVAGIAHYEFVRIHPFVDGNGRTARALATLILFLRGFDIKKFFALDDYYDHDRHAYYTALQTVEKDTVDTTEWLEYFLNGLSDSMSKIKEKVLALSFDKQKKNAKGQIALNERQMQIVEHIHENGKITTADVAGMFSITRQAALKELKKLLGLGVIGQKGKARSIHYVFD